MDRVGVLIVSKCLSASSMISALSHSEGYLPEFYVAERQVNPFNFARAKEHRVIPDLDVDQVSRFASRYRNRIDFALSDNEDFVIAGGRDAVEHETGVPVICVTKKYAIERSKADQRRLFEEIFPDANPAYKVFDPKSYHTTEEAVSDFRKFVQKLSSAVIKPDAPARGAGVGVWGSDFSTDDEMAEFFLRVLAKGRVVVEEKVEGEESSFQAFSDGKHFVATPLTRDYKRGLDGNRGSLTGGMGSYGGSSNRLPFVTPSEWERVCRAEERAFRRWRGKGSNPELRGIVLYDALMHTGRGFKVLERNSRGGNTELINLLTTMADDFADVCYKMVDGSLKGVNFSSEASVVTCAVPLRYGMRGGKSEEKYEVDLRRAQALEKDDRRVMVFPMDVRLEGGRTLMGKSRTVAVVGLGSQIEEAREASLRGAEALVGRLRWRKDIASSEDIERSSAHLRSLRRGIPVSA